MEPLFHSFAYPYGWRECFFFRFGIKIGFPSYLSTNNMITNIYSIRQESVISYLGLTLFRFLNLTHEHDILYTYCNVTK